MRFLMKNIFYCFVCTVLCFSVIFASCKKKDKAENEKIVVMIAGTEDDSTTQSKALHEVAKRLNDSGNFDVEVYTNGSLSNNTDNLIAQALKGAPLAVPYILSGKDFEKTELTIVADNWNNDTISIVCGNAFFNSMSSENKALFLKTFRDVGNEF
ncbi:MAG: hypothetical protein Ta2F_11130 [Termitinemataceae bacterium]|nr:MAG: hypothetical protein Ta2F_11130 [Termitinemataceae bacterium]